MSRGLPSVFSSIFSIRLSSTNVSKAAPISFDVRLRLNKLLISVFDKPDSLDCKAVKISSAILSPETIPKIYFAESSQYCHKASAASRCSSRIMSVLLIHFSVRNYAIAECQAVIKYSNDVIELSAFSEKLFSP